MQPLVDPVLRPYTADQIIGLLTCRSLQVASGLELLDATDSFVADISDDLASGSISHNNLATIHGTATLNVSRVLTWGQQRVRPYTTLTDLDSGFSARWNLGVYVLATPTRPVGLTPETYQVSGSDKLYLLSGPVGDSYSVASGAAVLAAAKAAVTAADPGAVVMFDGAASASTLPNAMTWPLTSSTVSTWLDVVNGLLAAISYQPVWMDWNGAYRSGPLLDPAVRSPEFTFSADDVLSTIVGQSRTVTSDLWQAPNWWRFIAQNWASTPVEGDGQYTVQNVSDGPASQSAVGRTVRKVVYVNAADQGSLQAQGDVTVAADKRVVTSLAVSLSPMPAQWHLDVALCQDAASVGLAKVATSQWQLDLLGADGTAIWDVVG